MSDVIESHRERVRATDPLVAVTDLGSVTDLGGGGWIETAGAVGVSATITADPAARAVHWGPPTTHSLHARAAGDDPADALGRLLDRWIAALDPEPGAGLVVSWPSRDTAPVAALARRGFAPRSIRAVRTRPATTGEPPSPGVRQASAGDLDVLCGLYLELVAYEAQFGWIEVLPSTPAAARAEIEGKLARGDGWCWLAEAGGEAVGMLAVHHPAHAGGPATCVNASPVAYVGSMYARPGSRGQGVGAALAAHAHAVAAAAGVGTILVDYVAPNPLSGPFWSRQGYRPLITTWGCLVPFGHGAAQRGGSAR
ncbi:GNAT family N-acetyltransferase [Nonomuraea sp. FMUSA5-5]|uniref:GNAT family N-acetyltransferase n=1 Tax=Nonomuraea composti TaxID=2720023 RepID=A0ABX1B135_9ACTN|nr:GNAT family N-acetyltransferase [Nonomuraea sp. FMUSA5-5]